MSVACPQTGFDVANRHLGIESGQRRRKRRRRIPVHEHDVRAFLKKSSLQSTQGRCCNVKQRLFRLHEVQIPVWSDPEGPEHLVQHGAVLRRYTSADYERFGKPLKVPDEDAKLDRLGTGTKHDEHSKRRHISSS